jgi:hypothetical protein
MNVYLHVSDASKIAPTRIGPFPFSTAEVPHFISAFRRGRYFSCEFEALGPDQAYELVGYDVDVSYGGST